MRLGQRLRSGRQRNRMVLSRPRACRGVVTFSREGETFPGRLRPIARQWRSGRALTVTTSRSPTASSVTRPPRVSSGPGSSIGLSHRWRGRWSHRIPLPLAAGRRLEQRAAISRIKVQFRDAHRDYLLALGVHRRAGSLAGVLEISTRLGELYEATKHPVHALSNYIEAGDERAAVALAKSPTPGDVNEALRAALAPWESGVVYSLARDLSTGVDVEIVAELLPPLLADAALEPGGRNSLALTDRAKAALAAVALQTAPEWRQAAMTQIGSDLFTDKLHDGARTAARALITATDLGIVDARNDLVACFLREHPHERINAAEIPHIAGGRNDLREEIVAAARGGSDRALTALLWAAVDGDEWCPMEEPATRLCERYTAVETLTLVRRG
jgi:hypothetical protein